MPDTLYTIYAGTVSGGNCNCPMGPGVAPIGQISYGLEFLAEPVANITGATI